MQQEVADVGDAAFELRPASAGLRVEGVRQRVSEELPAPREVDGVERADRRKPPGQARALAARRERRRDRENDAGDQQALGPRERGQQQHRQQRQTIARAVLPRPLRSVVDRREREQREGQRLEPGAGPCCERPADREQARRHQRPLALPTGAARRQADVGQRDQPGRGTGELSRARAPSQPSRTNSDETSTQRKFV